MGNFGFDKAQKKPSSDGATDSSDDVIEQARQFTPTILEDHPGTDVSGREPSGTSISQETLRPMLKNDGSKAMNTQLGVKLSLRDHQRFVLLSKRKRMTYGELIGLFLNEFDVDMDGRSAVQFKTLEIE